jgi:TolB-like protein
MLIPFGRGSRNGRGLCWESSAWKVSDGKLLSVAWQLGDHSVNFKRALVWLLVVCCASGPLVRADEETSEPPITIAVLPFAASSGDERSTAIAGAIGGLLLTRLSQAKGLVFVERAAIDQVLREREFARGSKADGQIRIGKLLGAQFVLTGSLTSTDDKIQVTAHLLEVSTSRVARSATVSSSADEIVESVDKLSLEFAKRFNLKLPRLTRDQIDQSPEASLHFIRGLGFYYAGMPEHATTQLL